MASTKDRPGRRAGVIPDRNPASDSGPEESLERLEEAFRRAARGSGGVFERLIAVGGRRLRIRAAGIAMLQVVEPAFEHLVAELDGRAADLEVLAWDSASTGIALPDPPAGAVASRRSVWQSGAGILTVLDDERRRGVVWVPSAAEVPSNEIAAPLRVFLHLAFGEMGTQFVHAAAVGRPDGGLLIVGRSGAGKSSTALSCLGSGLGVAGDDYVLASGGTEPWIHSLYSSAKLNTDQINRFPHLSQGVINRLAVGEKPEMLLGRLFRSSISRGFPLRAAVLPRVVGKGPTRARRIGGASLLAALAPSTIFQLPGTGRHTLTRLAGLLRRVPCFELQLGADLSEIPPELERVLDEVAA